MTEHISLSRAEGNISQAVVTVVLKRNVGYHLANTVLQILILQLISFMSFYFDLEDFPGRVATTLTTMLVITTILSSIQEVNGRTSTVLVLYVYIVIKYQII